VYYFRHCQKETITEMFEYEIISKKLYGTGNKLVYRVNHKTFVTVYMLLSINLFLLKNIVNSDFRSCF